MKLLHSEVEVIPGRPGSRPSVVSEAQPLPGSAVLRIVNPMPQENAFTVRLRCEHPMWQEEWYTLSALPPPPGSAQDGLSGKHDQRGAQDRTIKVYVPRGGSRDLLLRFDVPQQPESRAGRYPFVVEIEAQVAGGTEGGRRHNRVTPVPGAATIRPYYRWGLDITPEQRRVGLRRRAADFEVVVTNEGNDWLYCDLQLPRPRDMVLDCPTQRLAVPPPEPGETVQAGDARDARPGTQRSVPLRAVTHLKTVKGNLTPQPLLLSALRLDAPSVPPPAGDETFARAGAVVATPTTESQQAPGDRLVVYAPPVPTRLTDFFRQGASSARALVMSLIALALILPTAYVAFEQSRHAVTVQPLGAAYPGQPLLLGGRWVLGTRVTFAGKIGDRAVAPVTINSTPAPGKMGDPDRCRVVVPQGLNHMTGTMTAQRFARFVPWPFSSLMPKSACPITVGDALAPPSVYPITATLVAGENMTLKGTSLGDSTGTVRIGDKEAQIKKWTQGAVTVVVPPDLKPLARCPVLVTPAGGSALTPTGDPPPSTTPQEIIREKKQQRQAYLDRVEAAQDRVRTAQDALTAAGQQKLDFVNITYPKLAEGVDKNDTNAVADFTKRMTLAEQNINDNYQQRAKALDDANAALDDAKAALKRFDAGSPP